MKSIVSVKTLTFVLILSSGIHSFAGIEIQSKTLKEASHFELSGLKSGQPWSYSVHRSKGPAGLMASVQISGVTAEDLQALENFRDPRVHKVVVRNGVNNEATVDFYLADKMNFFDYQTDSPNHLVFDVYSDAPKSVSEIEVQKPEVGAFVSKKPIQRKKSENRLPASIEKLEVGIQNQLSGAKKAVDLKDLNVLDVADKDYKRFSPTDSELSPDAILKSENEIYLPFPELVTPITPSLADLDSNRLKFEIPKEDGEDNKITRLIVRLFQEEKYSVALKTFHFLREKYPHTKYEETLHLLKAEIYFRMWKKSKARADFETAMSLYKEHLVKYPQSPYRDKLSYFIGMSYYEGKEYVEALSRFQTELKENPTNSYRHSMNLAIAESLRQLRQRDAALDTLSETEKEAANIEKLAHITAEAKFRRGDVEFKEGQYESAIKEYQAALKAYPKDISDSPNAYYNVAESLFRMKKFKEALEAYKVFIQKYPTHEYTGYATNRLATLLEILGAPQDKVLGAYLENLYRYKGSPASKISKTKVALIKIKGMKPKEAEAAFKEILAEAPEGDIEGSNTFAKLAVADGHFLRQEFDKAFEIYSRFYKEEIRSPYLEIFRKRIFRNFTEELSQLQNKNSNMETIQLYLKNKDTWLKDNPRIDTEMIVGRAYENLNLFDEAHQFYSRALSKLKSKSEEDLKRIKVNEYSVTVESVKLRLAVTSMKLDNTREAANLIHEINRMDKMSAEEKVEFSLLSALIAEKEGRLETAIDQLKNLTAAWKDNSSQLLGPWLKIAKLYEAKKNMAEARAWLQKGLEMIEKSEEPMGEYGAGPLKEFVSYAADYFYRNQEYEKAVVLYKNLIEDYSSEKANQSALKFKLGKIYFDRKQINEAKKIWSDLKNDPEAALWAKMADENLSQYKWSEKFKKYVNKGRGKP